MKKYGGKYDMGQVVEFRVTDKYTCSWGVPGESTDDHKINVTLSPRKGCEKPEVGSVVQAKLVPGYGRFAIWLIQ